MSEHTKGPWKIKQGSSYEGEICTIYLTEPGYVTIASSNCLSGKGVAGLEELAEEAQANARLIAAAPDMLEALEYTRNIIREGLEVGFNPLHGDWADRLFESQGMTTKAIKKAKEG